MTDFVARTLARAKGTRGIQPRIAPITAPDPWQGPLDLELAELHEVGEREPTTRSRPTARGSSASTLDPSPGTPAEPGSRAASFVAPPTKAEMGSPALARSIDAEGLRAEREPTVPGSVSTFESLRVPGPIASHEGAPLGVPALRSTPSGPTLTRGSMPTPEPTTATALHPVVELERVQASSALPLPSLRARVRPGLDHGLLVHDRGTDHRIDSSLDHEAPTRSRDADSGLALEVDATVPDHEGEPTFVGTTSARSSVSTHRDPGPNRPRVATRSTPSVGPIDPAPIQVSTQVSTQAPIQVSMPTPPRRRNGAAGDPVVRVEIGKIELRAPAREPTPVDRGIPKPEGFVSLKQYLRERGGT